MRVTAISAPSQLWYRRDIEIQGRPAFRLRFNRREGAHLSEGCLPPDPKDGVADLETADTFVEALKYAFPLLTEPKCGWRSWDESLPREVAVRNLGPSRYGLAAIDGRSAPYMVLSPIAFDPTPDSTIRRRQSTVVHELAHLLQFETNLFLHWHKAALGSDPNWWLHESVALAVERFVYPDQPSSYPRFWEWATRPELSLESDPDGNLAAPFIQFLTTRLEPSFVPRLYDTTQDQVPSMRATEILDWQLQQRGLHLASDCADEPSVFIDYCVDAVLLGVTDTFLDSGIGEIVGPRAISDAFRAFPVRDAGRNMPIDHLGCRYFDFIPPKLGHVANLVVEVFPRPEPTTERKRNALHGELITISNDHRRITRNALSSSRDGQLTGIVPDFGVETVHRVILVLANCAFGPGWAYHDGLQFSISARLE